VLWALGLVVPAVPIAWLVMRNHVDMPFWDDWFVTTDVLIKAKIGTLTVHDIVTQVNESRLAVPRLLFLAIGLLSDGRIHLQLVVTFLLACLISWALFQLIRRSLPAAPAPLTLGLSLMVNLVLFTPMHGENWLWASQVICFLPAACLAVAILLLGSDLGTAKKLAAGGILCTLATFSYSNGLVTWVAAAPVVIALLGWRYLAVWGGLLAVNVGVYLHGFSAPKGQMLEGILHPVRALEYFLAFLGAPLALGRLRLAQVVGVVLLSLTAILAAYLWRERKDGPLRKRVLPWVSLALYAVASATLAAAGRSAFGVEQALARRYVSFSIYLLIALVPLVAIVAQDALAKRALSGTRATAFRVTVASLAAGLLGLHVYCFVEAAPGIVWVGRMLRYGKSCLVYAKAAPDTACLTSWVLPNVDAVTRMATDLDRLGFLRPGLARTPRLQDVQGEDGPDPIGVFEGLTIAGNEVTASGWAGLPGGGRPADSIVLAQEASDGSWLPIGFWPVLGPRADVAATHGVALRESGWVYTFPASKLERRPVRVSAWSFDCETGKAYLLANVPTVSY